jgi:CheY-like chemotaxis protein
MTADIQSAALVSTQGCAMLPGEASAPASGGLRILVVEDDRNTADSACMLLAIDGHLVEVVHDGAAAIDNICRGWPDVVLLDIGLPGMNGYAIATAVLRMDLASRRH